MDLKRVADVLEERAREAHEWNSDRGGECDVVLGDCPREACKEAVAVAAALRAEADQPECNGQLHHPEFPICPRCDR